MPENDPVPQDLLKAFIEKVNQQPPPVDFVRLDNEARRLLLNKNTLINKGEFYSTKDELAKKINKAALDVINQLLAMKGESGTFAFDNPGQSPSEALSVVPILLDEARKGIDMGKLSAEDQKKLTQIDSLLPAHKDLATKVNEIKPY